MNFILYIKSTDKEAFSYGNPTIVEPLRTLNIPFDFLDLDTSSEATLIDYAQKALQQSAKACIFFEVNPKNNTGAFIKMAHFINDNHPKFRVFINGENEFIKKLFFPVNGFSYHHLSGEQQIEIIREFLSNS